MRMFVHNPPSDPHFERSALLNCNISCILIKIKAIYWKEVLWFHFWVNFQKAFTIRTGPHSAGSEHTQPFLFLTSGALMQLLILCLRSDEAQRDGKTQWFVWRPKCGQSRIEKYNNLSLHERAAHSVISIADVGDRKHKKASCTGPESEHCPRRAQRPRCMCGSGVRIQWLEFTVDMCGIQGFPLITAKCQSEDVVAWKQNKA